VAAVPASMSRRVSISVPDIDNAFLALFLSLPFL